MNKFLGIGNVTKTPELKTTPAGNSVCTFTIAINRGFGDKKEVDYINVVAWRKLAETVASYVTKGKKVAVVGRVQVRRYEAKDGGKRYVTEIVADEVEFLSPKSEAGSGTPDGFEPVDDEECPF